MHDHRHMTYSVHVLINACDALPLCIVLDVLCEWPVCVSVRSGERLRCISDAVPTSSWVPPSQTWLTQNWLVRLKGSLVLMEELDSYEHWFNCWLFCVSTERIANSTQLCLCYCVLKVKKTPICEWEWSVRTVRTVNHYHTITLLHYHPIQQLIYIIVSILFIQY